MCPCAYDVLEEEEELRNKEGRERERWEGGRNTTEQIFPAANLARPKIFSALFAPASLSLSPNAIKR